MKREKKKRMKSAKLILDFHSLHPEQSPFSTFAIEPRYNPASFSTNGVIRRSFSFRSPLTRGKLSAPGSRENRSMVSRHAFRFGENASRSRRFLTRYTLLKFDLQPCRWRSFRRNGDVNSIGIRQRTGTEGGGKTTSMEEQGHSNLQGKLTMFSSRSLTRGSLVNE